MPPPILATVLPSAQPPPNMAIRASAKASSFVDVRTSPPRPSPVVAALQQWSAARALRFRTISHRDHPTEWEPIHFAARPLDRKLHRHGEETVDERARVLQRHPH